MNPKFYEETLNMNQTQANT